MVSPERSAFDEMIDFQFQSRFDDDWGLLEWELRAGGAAPHVIAAWRKVRDSLRDPSGPPAWTNASRSHLSRFVDDMFMAVEAELALTFGSLWG